MTQIVQKDLIPLHVYRERREEYLKKMIAYKKNRRVRLGNHMSILFENRQTVLFQIQELINSEDLTDVTEIAEYLDIYAGMLPADNELSATLFIEMDNQTLLEELLLKLKGIEQHLSLKIGDETVPAQFEEEHDDREFTTSVHYLKFPLSRGLIDRIKDETTAATVEIVLSHPNLSVSAALSADHINSLRQDL